MRISVVSQTHVHFSGSLVHELDKGANVALWSLDRFVILFIFQCPVSNAKQSVTKVLSEDHGCIVATRQHEAVKQIPDGEDLALDHVGRGSNSLASLFRHLKVSGLDIHFKLAR